MSNLIFITDNDNNVGIGSNMINDIKGNINITQNLNVSGNVNLTNGGMIKTTGIGSFGSINCGVGTFTSIDTGDGLIKTTGIGSFGSINCGVGTFTSIDSGSITSSNTPNAIVRRDGSGNFAAGTITADLTGNATTAGTANTISGTISHTKIYNIGDASVNHASTAGTATSAGTANTISGSISYSQITGTPSAYTLPTNLTNYNSHMATTLNDMIKWTMGAGYMRGFYFSIASADFLAINQMYVKVSQVNMHAPAFTTTSDDRLKINEELITNATNTLLKLRPQIYDKKKSLTNTETNKEAGLIVQEIYYEVPELRYLITIPNDASLIDDNKYRNFDDIRNDPDYSNWGHEEAYLNYNGLIPYLIQGFKEVNVEIEKLKTEVSTLKQENIQQQAKIETLEANTMN